VPRQAELKAAARRAVDASRDDLIGLARQIYGAPETGFKEVRTSRLVAERLAQLGVPVESGLALTGLKAVLNGGGGPGPTVAILGELDSVVCRDHPDHDPETGAVHACGHNAQVASMLGAGLALQASGALQALAGRVVLMAVPAEEFIEIEERLQMRAGGKLDLLAGKAEMLRVGAFDDVDLAMMVHATTNPDEGRLGIGGTTNGMLAKFIRYVGRSAHAGGAPEKGVNALYAAHVALAGINALRETFRDEDHVRVHPIITRGGDIVSAVPADVRLETFVRASTAEAIQDANRKVTRALKAGALALGARVEIVSVPGYLPLRQDELLSDLFKANAEEVVGREHVGHVGHRGGGTDMGDLGHVMPVLHPFAGGATGEGHGGTYRLVEYEQLVTNPAQALAMTVIDLLSDGAAEARRVLDAFQPRFTRQEYLSFVSGLASSEQFDASDADADPTRP
jgi:amidohydrolase